MEEKKLAACLKCVKISKHSIEKGVWWYGCGADEVTRKEYDVLTGETIKHDANCYIINENGECPHFIEKVEKPISIGFKIFLVGVGLLFAFMFWACFIKG